MLRTRGFFTACALVGCLFTFSGCTIQLNPFSGAPPEKKETTSKKEEAKKGVASQTTKRP